jgi:hypothetical protein
VLKPEAFGLMISGLAILLICELHRQFQTQNLSAIFLAQAKNALANFLLRPRLREEDAPGDVAWYIWMNPVSAGLVSKPEEYQYSGPISSGPRMLPCSEAWVPPGLEAKGSKTNIKQKQLT